MHMLWWKDVPLVVRCIYLCSLCLFGDDNIWPMREEDVLRMHKCTIDLHDEYRRALDYSCIPPRDVRAPTCADINALWKLVTAESKYAGYDGVQKSNTAWTTSKDAAHYSRERVHR